WLSPCDLVRVPIRQPPLRKEVLALDDPDEIDAVVVEEVGRALRQSQETAVLVFVYRRASAERLAVHLAEVLGDIGGALPYHSGMSTAARAAVRDTFVSGRTRCVVTTTALALGVNLPPTHVIVRDATFPGVGRLEVMQLLQMLGRAGRGETAGEG